MLTLDIVFPAFAISAFLLLYYVFVGFLVVYFVTVFNYTEARTNNLANWFWVAEAVALLIAGVLSDRLLVRKPFLIVGTVISLIGTALFALAATKPGTSYGTFVFYFILMAGGTGDRLLRAWMAAYTETVEKRNPAAIATGLAVWGLDHPHDRSAWPSQILTFVVSATSTLVDKGPRVQQIVSTYPAQVKVLQTVDPATLATLHRNPNNPLAQAKAASELCEYGAGRGTRRRAQHPVCDRARDAVGHQPGHPGRLGGIADQPGGARGRGRADRGQVRAPARAGAGPARRPRARPARRLGVPARQQTKVQLAATRLGLVSAVPPADLAYLQANGAKVAQAPKGQPGPVADLVVGVLHRAVPDDPGGLPADRALEPAQGQSRRARARADGRARARATCRRRRRRPTKPRP